MLKADSFVIEMMWCHLHFMALNYGRGDYMNSIVSIETKLNIAWMYYYQNLSLRSKYLNFFIVISIFLTGGLFTILSAIQENVHLRGGWGIIAGFVLMFCSFVFWNIDKRSTVYRREIKEIILRLEEDAIYPDEMKLFKMAKRTKGLPFHTSYLHGAVFITFFAIGILGVGLSLGILVSG